MFSPPGVRTHNYVSYMCSPYHHWFAEMGYPQLDILEYEDGEFAIIQYFRTPVIPALTQWNHVLTKIRHTEMTPWFCQKYVVNLDVEKRFIWEEQEKKEKELDREQAAREKHDLEFADLGLKYIKSSPDLMDRIARNGLQEMRLSKWARHIPNHFYRGEKKKDALLYSSKPAS